MLSHIFSLLYGTVVFFLLWQAFRVMSKGFRSVNSRTNLQIDQKNSGGDRTGRLTIHPELLDQQGRITNEELLTVRFSEDNEPPQSAETSAE